MATEQLRVPNTPAKTVKFVIRNVDDEVLDHADHVFRSLGTATTPGLATTEVAAFGGANQSVYRAELDLDYLNTSPAVEVFYVEAYEQVGGAFDLSTALLRDSIEWRVAGGSLVFFGSPGDIVPGYVVRLGMNVTNTDGDFVQCYAWVEFHGQPVTLGVGDTCSFDCFEYDTELSQFDGGTAPAGPNANNHFEATVAEPNFQDNVCYTLKAVVVLQGVTLYGQRDMPVVG